MIEEMCKNGIEECREVHRILRCDPLSCKGAEEILGLDRDATQALIKQKRNQITTKIAKVQTVDTEPEIVRCMGALDLAIATFKHLRASRDRADSEAGGERILTSER